MTLSNVQAVYPAGVFPWVDRVDQQDIVFAEDVNPLAAEIEAIETNVGTTPNVESSPPNGGQAITYPTLSSRVSDAMDNAQLPICTLGSPSFTCPNNTSGSLIPHQRRFDPFNCYNGTDFTAVASGWWVVTGTMVWDWWSDGYSEHRLCLNGFNNYIDCHSLDWEFSGNQIPQAEIFPQPIVTPRWWEFGKRPKGTSVTWQGLLNKGDRLSMLAENGTSNPGHTITNVSFKAIMIRTVSGNFTSG